MPYDTDPKKQISNSFQSNFSWKNAKKILGIGNNNEDDEDEKKKKKASQAMIDATTDSDAS